MIRTRTWQIFVRPKFLFPFPSLPLSFSPLSFSLSHSVFLFLFLSLTMRNFYVFLLFHPSPQLGLYYQPLSVLLFSLFFLSLFLSFSFTPLFRRELTANELLELHEEHRYSRTYASTGELSISSWNYGRAGYELELPEKFIIYTRLITDLSINKCWGQLLYIDRLYYNGCGTQD